MSDKSNPSDDTASWRTGIELNSTKTFHWTIKNFNLICDNSSLIRDQKIEVSVDATPAVPTLTLKLLLAEEFVDSIRCLNLRYLCQAQQGRPIPPYIAILHYTNPHGLNFSTTTGLRNTATGFFRIGSERKQKLVVFARQDDGEIHLKFTWEFYRNLVVDPCLTFPGESWNKLHDQSKKTELLEMLNSGQFADVKVVSSDGREFYAHKLMLKAGSEVFEAMFRHQMAESTTGVITLGDLSSRAVKFLLHFLYSSEVLPISTDEGDHNGNDVTLEEVFYITSKYGLKELATHLEDDLGKFCKEENAVSLLRLCKLYSLEKGKKVVFDLIRKNQWNVLHDLAFSQL